MKRSLFVRFPFVSYTILAFAISWILWLPVVFSGTEMSVPIRIFHVLGGLGPFMAALIMLRLTGGKSRIAYFQTTIVSSTNEARGKTAGTPRRRGEEKERGTPWGLDTFYWRLPIKWYALVLLMPIGLLFFSYIALYLLGGRLTGIAELPSIWLYPILFLYMSVLGGGLEEPGWRGFALPRLLVRYSPLSASLVLGIVWGIWHLPLFWSQSTSQGSTPLGLFLLSGVALSVIFTWSYLYTHGSIFLAIILHGGINTSLNWFPMGENSVQPFLPFTMVVVLTAILLALFSPALRRKRINGTD